MRTILAAALITGFACVSAAASADSGALAGDVQRAAASTLPLESRPDGWRYRWHQGYWWYYTPQQTWLRYEDNRWKPFLLPPPVPAAPAVLLVPAQNPSNRLTFGVDSP